MICARQIDHTTYMTHLDDCMRSWDHPIGRTVIRPLLNGSDIRTKSGVSMRILDDRRTTRADCAMDLIPFTTDHLPYDCPLVTRSSLFLSKGVSVSPLLLLSASGAILFLSTISQCELIAIPHTRVQGLLITSPDYLKHGHFPFIKQEKDTPRLQLVMSKVPYN